MSAAVALIEALEAEGLPPEAIIRVLKNADKKRDNTNAVRQARHRAKKAASNAVTVTGVTGVSNDRDNLTFPEVKNSELKSSSQKFALPDDIPAEPWAGWEEMRKRIHKTPTNHARSLAVAELRRLRDEEGWPPGEVLNHCTMNSYQGIFPPRRSQHDRSDSLTAGALSDISAQLARN